MQNPKKIFLLILPGIFFTNLYLKCMDNLKPQILENKNLNIHQDKIIADSIICKGVCLIEGNGFNLHFGKNASITVAENSKLFLKNITIEGVDEKIKLASNTSKIILMDNVTWNIKNYFIFDLGSFTLQNGIFNIIGTNVKARAHFLYKSSEKSILQENSLLKMKDIFFTFSPNNQTQFTNGTNLIETENKSTIYFENSILFLKQNLQLLKCWLIIDGTLRIMAEKMLLSFLVMVKTKKIIPK